MDLTQKIRTLPTSPGVYLYKNAEGAVIYVGKAKNLRSRVRSYFVEGRAEDAKTGSLLREAVDVEYILVDNEKEALALENNLIKQKQPRFNILLRDDKTYPYVKLTLGDPYPRVYVTRRLDKDGSAYYGPYFPASLAYRLLNLLRRHFGIFTFPVDDPHKRNPALQIHLMRYLGPDRDRLLTSEGYQEAVRDARLFLEGRQGELTRSLHDRMQAAAEREQFELAAKYRDLISTVEQLQEKQRIAATEGTDTDVFGYHFENGMLAVNLFHVRNGHVLDRRELFWEDIPEDAMRPSNEYRVISNKRAQTAGSEQAPDGLITHYSLLNTFSPGAFFSALLKQLYIGQQYVPAEIFVPIEFEDRESLADLLAEQAGHRVEIRVPRRGEKLALMDLAGNNARASYDQRFRVLKPNARIIAEAVQRALDLPAPPRRIECFDISHIQGAETVASMVVWEDGRMKKSDYRKFIIRTVEGVDDFASMREVVSRRYSRVLGRNAGVSPAGQVLSSQCSVLSKDGTSDSSSLSTPTQSPMPSLILIDGGIGQLHAAAEALAALDVTGQPLASIAKREEIIYLHGRENEPVVLDHHNPVLHLIQLIRDEAHRFAITFHRKRREIRDRSSELLDIPGIGDATRRRLLEHFGSARAVSQASEAALTAVVTRPQAEAIIAHFRDEGQGTRDKDRGVRGAAHGTRGTET